MWRGAEILAAQQGSITPVLRQFFGGSGTDIAPAGAKNVLIELMGPGGGGNWVNGTTNTAWAGGGGGGYTRLSIAILGGQSINWNAGTPGPGAVAVNTGSAAGANATASGTVAGGTFALQANVGGPATGSSGAGAPGAGGGASGGSINSSGINGAAAGLQPPTGKGGNSATPPAGGQIGTSPGVGGPNCTVSNSGSNQGTPEGGGGGGYQSGASGSSQGGPGAVGIVSLYYT